MHLEGSWKSTSQHITCHSPTQQHVSTQWHTDSQTNFNLLARRVALGVGSALVHLIHIWPGPARLITFFFETHISNSSSELSLFEHVGCIANRHASWADHVHAASNCSAQFSNRCRSYVTYVRHKQNKPSYSRCNCSPFFCAWCRETIIFVHGVGMPSFGSIVGQSTCSMVGSRHWRPCCCLVCWLQSTRMLAPVLLILTHCFFIFWLLLVLVCSPYVWLFQSHSSRCTCVSMYLHSYSWHVCRATYLAYVILTISISNMTLV